MLDKLTRDFEEKIVNIVNSTPLPPEVMRVVMENLTLKLEIKANSLILKERANEQSTHTDNLEELPVD